MATAGSSRQSNDKRRSKPPITADRLLELAVAAALKAIHDGKFDKAFSNVASSISRRARQRRLRVVGEPKARRFPPLSWQARLEARLDHIKQATALVRRKDLSLSDGLDRLDESVAQLTLALEVAGNLPFVKQKRAQVTIEKLIDELKQAMFKTAMAPLKADQDDA